MIRSIPSDKTLQGVRDALMREYRRRTPKSALAHHAPQGMMPGGDTRSTAYLEPYPLHMDRGFGCRVTDIDGSTYPDLLDDPRAFE
jgi:glutamate-1-semialdehyde 2,1-aminomutase